MKVANYANVQGGGPPSISQLLRQPPSVASCTFPTSQTYCLCFTGQFAACTCQAIIGGGLALGSFFIRALTTPAAGAATASGSRRSATTARSAAAEADAKRAREAAEEEDLAAAAERELRRFDRELQERERRRQVRTRVRLKVRSGATGACRRCCT